MFRCRAFDVLILTRFARGSLKLFFVDLSSN